MDDETLAAAPFKLDGAAIAWVRETFAALVATRQAHASSSTSAAWAATRPRSTPSRPSSRAASRACPGPTPPKRSRSSTASTRSADVPLLISADLEGSRMSLPFGTEVPNPLALAAVDDVEATRQISQIMADEAHAAGINWSLDAGASTSTPRSAARSSRPAATAATSPRSRAACSRRSRSSRRRASRRRRSTGPAKVMTTATSTSSPPSIRCRWTSGRRPSAGSIAPRSRPACSR